MNENDKPKVPATSQHPSDKTPSAAPVPSSGYIPPVATPSPAVTISSAGVVGMPPLNTSGYPLNPGGYPVSLGSSHTSPLTFTSPGFSGLPALDALGRPIGATGAYGSNQASDAVSAFLNLGDSGDGARLSFTNPAFAIPGLSKDTTARLQDIFHFDSGLLKFDTPELRKALGSHFAPSIKDVKDSADAAFAIAQSKAEAATLNAKVARLEAELAQLADEMTEGKGQSEEQIAALEEKLKEAEGVKTEALRMREIDAIASSIHKNYKARLLGDQAFLDRFKSGRPTTAAVLSVDIRRSTELMKQARDPAAFAEFLTLLFGALKSVILEHFGYFDKFTGDGILAFFPDFLSGVDSQYRTQLAAKRCHESFATIYKSNHHLFRTVLVDVGLGIGIDHGEIQIQSVAESFTAIGLPVIYACRLAGAPAHHTYINSQAHVEAARRFGAHAIFPELELSLKNNEKVFVHSVILQDEDYQPQPPAPFEPEVKASMAELSRAISTQKYQEFLTEIIS